jgi:hypothetical protein
MNRLEITVWGCYRDCGGGNRFQALRERPGGFAVAWSPP